VPVVCAALLPVGVAFKRVQHGLHLLQSRLHLVRRGLHSARAVNPALHRPLQRPHGVLQHRKTSPPRQRQRGSAVGRGVRSVHHRHRQLLRRGAVVSPVGGRLEQLQHRV
jgi:hypothetical protein